MSIGGFYLLSTEVLASDPCAIQHPFNPPKKDLAGTCHNCGMMRPMWARTFYHYELAGEKKEVCSLHCLAETTLNSGKEPENVQVALYSDPYTMVPAESAFYVVGSKARGTMTMQSKLAFASEKEAMDFAAQCGGTVVGFKKAFAMATASFQKENQKIAQNRLHKGKIVEPVDNKDICPVCNMYPARFPKNKCQIQTKGGQVVHFCSTQCMFEYFKNPGKYEPENMQPQLIWVVDYNSGSWIYGKNAFYVVGSTEAGCMGKEAFPFMNKAAAEKFSEEKKGLILGFSDVTIDKILL